MTSSIPRDSFVLALGLFFGACGTSTGASDASGRDAATQDVQVTDSSSTDAAGWRDSLRIGTWSGRFQPLSESGNAFTLVAGPQGGYHIDIAAAFAVPTFDSTAVELEAVDATSEQTLSYPVQRTLESTNVQKLGDLWVWSGDRVIFLSVDPQQVVGREIEIRARATRGKELAEAKAAGTVSPL